LNLLAALLPCKQQWTRHRLQQWTRDPPQDQPSLRKHVPENVPVTELDNNYIKPKQKTKNETKKKTKQ
jgi:hypothetical protein